MKPNKGRIVEAKAYPWNTEDGKFVLCVAGFHECVHPSQGIRTSFVLKTIEAENGDRQIETRNSVYDIECTDLDWKIIQDMMKSENLDLERMKK